ncbi:hypothetical protein CONPUDRAFT_82172 [Coniophora puteana RWD-64-598 SS2]|uniref:Uncharacterized protein n=1 Tax=Coniophora puteana (strain RWD-64-598) TaxID=741705 RepID=A0A5M3MR38_CONPW|nr:uncharacterized protein CONPUDRAFT_82172 [Coniophora puteana RWD-64-598 SS2]EIW81115.1 hypothetical protein CONPUDRAFT_82172 [Coniophora puteana RWD-64-598 SS2]
MTARLSSNPILFGSGRVPPALSSTFFNPHRLSIEFSPEWGLRREAACEKLREMAIEKAWCARVINDNSPQSLAVCFILQFLEDQLGSAGDRRMWASAFVQQLRVMFERRAAIGSNSSIDGPAGPAITNNLRFSSYSAMPAPTWETWIPSSVQITSMTQLHLANTFAPASWSLDISMNQDQLGLAYVREPHIRDMGLRWCIQIMREALISACRSEICVYTIHDEIMLVGPPPPSPAEVISGAFDDLPWWDFGSFLLFVRPFTYRATQIALESPQWQTRRLNGQPFSLSCLEEHLSSLSSLHTLMKRAQVQYSGLFSPEGLTARYQALCHSAPDMANDERNLRFWTMNRNILYTSRVFLVSMKSALGALTIPIYLDLLARIRDEEAQRQFGSGTHQTTSQRRGVDDVQQITQLLINLKRVLLPYAREVLHDIQSGANLGWITHLGNEPLKLWCSIILDSTPIEDGGDGITRAQRVASLETAFRIFKILTWSWPRVFDDPLVLHTQHVVEEGIRNGVYSSSSMVDHVPRSSFGIDPLTSENTGIWPSYLGLEEAWKVMEPIAAVSLKTVYTADAIPAMPWPKVHSIPSTLDLPDIQQMMQGLNLHDEPAGGSAPPSLPPSSAPTSKVAFTDLYNFNEAAFRSSSRGVQAQTQTQTRPQAGAPLQMPDLSEFDMTFFGGEAVPTTSLPKPSFAGIPSAHSDPGIHMRGYSQTSPTGWLEWTVGHFWS